MKIKNITYNNKKKHFELTTSSKEYVFPYSRLKLKPTLTNKISDVYVDSELGNEAFTYTLESGKEDTIHIDQVLDYNADLDYLTNMLLYKLTLKAQQLIKKNKVNKREIIRRMQTSPTQFYRLLDQTFYNKSIDQMIKLLSALDCTVDIVFKKAA